jgi:hypothetical protein
MLAWREKAISDARNLAGLEPIFGGLYDDLDFLDAKNLARRDELVLSTIVVIDTWCFDSLDSRKAIKYPDLEIDEAFRLEIPQNRRTTRELILSGVGEAGRP